MRFMITQGVAALAWWTLLAFVPDSRAWFIPGELGSDAVIALAVPDIGLYGIGSLIALLALIACFQLRRLRG